MSDLPASGKDQRPRRQRRSLVWQSLLVILVLVVGALFFFLWWIVPPALYRHSDGSPDAQLKAITDTRTAFLAGLVGVGALLTFWLNFRMYRINAKTLNVTEQSHVAERYTKAVEQLGDTALAVRLGGIYALERLAHDYPEPYHPTVIEVLSAFIREGSRQGVAGRLKHEEEATDEAESASPDPSTQAAAAATDVLAAFAVLSRLPSRPDEFRRDLSGAYLPHVDLRAVGSYKANLSHVILRGANLTGAILSGANLSQAILTEANLSGAQLGKADLSGVHLGKANLTRTWFLEANLSGATLHHAKLEYARLEGADLSYASLGMADLRGASLSRANLSNTRLGRAILFRATLLESTGLTQKQLDKAKGDKDTELPQGLSRPSNWS
jgi:uncharacterized protein YjbI with pentapeptide repeats